MSEYHGRLGGRSIELRAGWRSIELRAGWRAAAGAFGVASLTAAVVSTADGELGWLAVRGAVIALVAFTAGLVGGSQRLAGLASLPMLLGALVGPDQANGPPWGRSLIVGCLWYVALELAWASMEQRRDVDRTEAVGRQRRREVAQVVMVAILVGAGGSLLASVAPTRTLALQAAVIAAFVAAMVGAAQRLAPDPTNRDRPDRAS